MSVLARLLLVIGVILTSWCYAPDAFALGSEDNRGNYTEPTYWDLPDREVPGHLVNLGPTGARAILKKNSFIVKYVFPGSPAAGRLRVNDEIVGVFGKSFSAHRFNDGSGYHGYEGPVMDFGEAIEQAEGTDGNLVLNLINGSTVTVTLKVIGTFSATFPYECPKSELLRAKALKYLADHSDSRNVWQSHGRSAVTLALLTSDDSLEQALGKEMALTWSKESPDAGTWTWNLSYQLITLCEYHLLTKDPAVLPMITTVVGYLEKAQYSGKIEVWTAQPDENQAEIDAAQQLYEGSFAHAPYIADYSPPGGGYGHNGYGPMQFTTILAVTAWQLAGRCAVAVDSNRIGRALAFIHRGTSGAGHVAYGGEFTLNAGLVDPVQWRNSNHGANHVGRALASYVAHKLSPGFVDTPDYLEKYRGHTLTAFRSLPDGHADANLGIFWGLMGARATGDYTVLRATLDYHKAFFNMSRCFDGSFVLQPNRDYGDSGYYMGSRYHPTAYMALTLGFNKPKLWVVTGGVTPPTSTPAPVAPIVTTTAATDITGSSAKSGGGVASAGGALLTARGVCWATSTNPTTANNKTTDGTSTGAFTSTLSGLAGGTKYYVRAYATNSVGTSYGSEVSFTTLTQAPTVTTTTAATDITATSAKSGGNVTATGGASVTARGVCWATTTNPTTANFKTSNGTGTGSFTSTLSGLTAGSTYYVRAYATNSVGTTYGPQITFATTTTPIPGAPTVTTTEATDITMSGAISGGNVTATGDTTVTVRGVCWATTGNPTTANSKTSDGTGGGSFISTLSGLAAGKTYYVRAYATNSAGTSYGPQVFFDTPSPAGGGSGSSVGGGGGSCGLGALSAIVLLMLMALLVRKP